MALIVIREGIIRQPRIPTTETAFRKSYAWLAGVAVDAIPANAATDLVVIRSGITTKSMRSSQT
jgi:hypothetical protein